MPQLKQSELVKKLKKIKMLILDVDGVLTNDKLYIGPDGAEFKRFDVGDGLSTYFARKIGVELAIISSRPSPATESRASELRIHNLYQQHDKLLSYADLKEKTGIKDSEICFIGNDLLDIPLAKLVGIPISTANGIKELKRICHYVTKHNGGDGAVREVIELLLESRGKTQEDMIK